MVEPFHSKPALTPAQAQAIQHVRASASLVRQHACERIERHLTRAGFPSATLRDILAAVRESVRVTVNFHPDRLLADGSRVVDGLLRDGLYRSQFETGVTSASPTAYPDGGAPSFGSCHVVLRSSMLARCTYTLGDSYSEPEHSGTIDVFEPLLAELLDEAAPRFFAVSSHPAKKRPPASAGSWTNISRLRFTVISRWPRMWRRSWPIRPSAGRESASSLLLSHSGIMQRCTGITGSSSPPLMCRMTSGGRRCRRWRAGSYGISPPSRGTWMRTRSGMRPVRLPVIPRSGPIGARRGRRGSISSSYGMFSRVSAILITVMGNCNLTASYSPR